MAKARIQVPDHLKSYLEVESCEDFPIDRYYVSSNEEKIYETIISLRSTTDELLKMGIPYLNSTLLYGKTGTGKTTLGRYIAFRLNLDFAYINFAKLIEGSFGQTSKNISDVFRFMADTECVFMMDEIDCITTRRDAEGNNSGNGEMTRITITVMQELDYYKNHKVKSIILGATNMYENLDPALISRFSLVHKVNHLNNKEKNEYICQFLDRVGVPYDNSNIAMYCAQNSTITQRQVESDMVQCIIKWIKNGKKNYQLEHLY